jgi:hypothetical protein
MVCCDTPVVLSIHHWCTRGGHSHSSNLVAGGDVDGGNPRAILARPREPDQPLCLLVPEHALDVDALAAEHRVPAVEAELH